MLCLTQRIVHATFCLARCQLVGLAEGRCLGEYGITLDVVDPWADEKDAMREYGVRLKGLDEIADADCVIVAVAHDDFKSLGLEGIRSLYDSKKPDEEKVLIDVKGLYNIADLKGSGFRWWRL